MRFALHFLLQQFHHFCVAMTLCEHQRSLAVLIARLQLGFNLKNNMFNVFKDLKVTRLILCRSIRWTKIPIVSITSRICRELSELSQRAMIQPYSQVQHYGLHFSFQYMYLVTILAKMKDSFRSNPTLPSHKAVERKSNCPTNRQDATAQIQNYPCSVTARRSKSASEPNPHAPCTLPSEERCRR